jgi:hypothetical protein
MKRASEPSAHVKGRYKNKHSVAELMIAYRLRVTEACVRVGGGRWRAANRRGVEKYLRVKAK